MENGKTVDFFITANSGRGFFSYFDTLYDRKTAQGVYLLKGGAGNGKSTLMKRIASLAEAKGLWVERLHCPSDEMSLDAVILPQVGLGLIDATPPHALEATYHALSEQYLSLSSYVDATAMEPDRKEIIDLTGRIRACHDRAKQHFAAAKDASNAAIGAILSGVDTGRIRERGTGLAARNIPARKGQAPSFLRRRFLGGLTPHGPVSFPHTVGALMEVFGHREYRTIRVCDSYGLSPFLLAPILERAQANGYVVYACYDPLVPSWLQSVLLPELGLAFVSTVHSLPHSKDSRNIRLDAMIDPLVLRNAKQRLKIFRQAQIALVEEGCECLAQALSLHDRLEALYAAHTDFAGLDTLARELAARFGL